MAWYLFEREKQYPYISAEDASDWRMPVGVVLLAIGAICALASIAGIFFGGWVVSGWALPGAFLGVGLGVWLTRS